MADITICSTDPEQGITEIGYKNIRQYDLRAFYGKHLIASLWQDKEENWHWTKRLYDLGSVEDLETEYIDDKSIEGILNEFAVCVADWLNDESSYLHNIASSIDDMKEIVVEN